MVRDAAGHYAVIVAKIGGDVDRDAVERHPMTNPDPDGRDFCLAAIVLRYPDADPVLASLAGDPECCKCLDDPALEV